MVPTFDRLRAGFLAIDARNGASHFFSGPKVKIPLSTLKHALISTGLGCSVVTWFRNGKALFCECRCITREIENVSALEAASGRLRG